MAIIEAADILGVALTEIDALEDSGDF